MDDAEVTAFATTVSEFLRVMERRASRGEVGLTPLGTAVEEFLGVELATVETLTEQFAPHEVVDLDVTLDALVTEHGGTRHGVSGLQRNHVSTFEEFFERGWADFRLGPVRYARMATGPDTVRRVVALGLAMLHVDGVPVVWLQRAGGPERDTRMYTVEVMCPDPAVGAQLVDTVRERMAGGSTLRGQVISFTADDFDHRGAGAGLRFLRRPEVAADQVVLPDGVLARIRRHVLGVGEHGDLLRRSGQHLKRGVLLYGPPGTGKTHVVRHLLTATPGVTAVLLSGRTLQYVADATKLARAAQPAIVVLEDCDLVAEQRGGNTNAALFETLEAMDGLDGDADVTFILTTNRLDLLERALSERPGRVDLAVAVEKPDAGSRRRLLALYAGALVAAGQVGQDTLTEVAALTEGTTASFAKELVRRTVLDAAAAGEPPSDRWLVAAATEMMSDAEALTRTLLGAGAGAGADLDDDVDTMDEGDDGFDDEGDDDEFMVDDDPDDLSAGEVPVR